MTVAPACIVIAAAAGAITIITTSTMRPMPDFVYSSTYRPLRIASMPTIAAKGRMYSASICRCSSHAICVTEPIGPSMSSTTAVTGATSALHRLGRSDSARSTWKPDAAAIAFGFGEMMLPALPPPDNAVSNASFEICSFDPISIASGATMSTATGVNTPILQMSIVASASPISAAHQCNVPSTPITSVPLFPKPAAFRLWIASHICSGLIRRLI
ncbi:hypothetical protein PG1629B_1161 [Bifidobacterium pseudolongum subsp. pseudolongum]|nr:hypothetical protein PG1629B_1161 [Bifidobacterium pseudolongum subsp. pseudolongum]RYQ63303.1 hypothetical protein PG1513B_1153 [Bifidobacterium pseudolongum subsp. pseudolongum]